jgi:hypothetical protein
MFQGYPPNLNLVTYTTSPVVLPLQLILPVLWVTAKEQEVVRAALITYLASAELCIAAISDQLTTIVRTAIAASISH